jgi:DNA topoisomerase-2
LRAKLNGGEFSEIHPEYEKFRGTITRDSKNKYHSHGLYRVIDTNKLEITELPLKVWTQSYKNFLEKQIEANKIAGYEDHSSEERVKFIIKTKGSGGSSTHSSLLHKMSSEQIEKLFKLSSAINMTNMYLFDVNGKIKRYRDVVHILEDFYKVRLEFYHKRRTHILNKFKYSLKFLKNKIRFIQEIMDDKLVIYRLAHSKVVDLLDSRGYDKMAPEWKSETKRSYEYLMNIRMTAFTKERIDELAKRYNSIETEYNKLKNTTPEQMWLSDLGTFEEDFYE